MHPEFRVIKNGAGIRAGGIRSVILRAVDEFLHTIRADRILLERARVWGNELRVMDEGIPLGDGVYVVGFGKASGEMALALERLLTDKLLGGVVNTDHPVTLDKIRVNVTSHPLPDELTVEKSLEIVDFLESLGSEDTVIFLVSGGASSLFEVPSVPLDEYRRIISGALRSGKDIVEINRLRISLSEVKGGKLLRHFRGHCFSLILSDVPGSPELVGSGPTYPHGNMRFSRRCKNIVIADTRWAREKFSDVLHRYGIRATVYPRDITTGMEDAVSLMRGECQSPGNKVFGGEVTLHIGEARGKGGRNQELALRMSRIIEGRDAVFLALGTDGRDGNSDATGAIVDGETARILRGMGMDVDEIIARHDSSTALSNSGDAIVTGPTGSNLADIYACFKKI